MSAFSRKYSIRQVSGFRLDKVKAKDVIALCTRLDYILPPDLVPSAGPADPPPGTAVPAPSGNPSPPDGPVAVLSPSELRARRAELKALGFERFTVDQMWKEWDIGTDKIELMADRAVGLDHIHDDIVILRGKQTQLWARRKI